LAHGVIATDLNFWLKKWLRFDEVTAVSWFSLHIYVTQCRVDVFNVVATRERRLVLRLAVAIATQQVAAALILFIYHSFIKCLIHLIVFIVCCHPLMTLKSHLSLEKQPHILDPVTILTATNLSFITPSYYTIRPISLFLVHFFHRIAFHFLSCLVLFCCTVHYCLFSVLIFSLLATSSIIRT